ncbi:DNA internalization-related competence protein ComEC/Rec2 [Paucibacter sp. DJ2R-2]|uniref:DNA internalization-related competence protein ComEC/Rec2 n=1 Tax=Paucibacter sp. DJ2R-2 TaxID=2893558 RepID=UPI0021E4D6B6|nr:DNA internalization-related competence protein ComEC/Rec2 [Paucibacter sp. DJ2R-2]MCV2420818.1 DNA internalization-related competence protein ComEC/Rec2 [Paucibacter sp. DJ4R-1]MCV2440017.1 DNA internalization-related competence protein ComEC/Rec2 [Paucibacter sp. DJ2R-2]
MRSPAFDESPGPAGAVLWPVLLALPVLAWLGGLVLLQTQRELPGEAEFTASLLAGLGCCVMVGRWWGRRRAALLWAALAGLLLAFSYASWRAELRLAERLPEAWEGRDLLLIGRVDSLPAATLGQAGAPGWRFEFELESARAGPLSSDPPLTLPSRLLLSAYAEHADAAPPPLRAGERWQLLVRLKQPQGLMNPHGFDYELWLFEQGLRASGVLRPGGAQRRLAEAPITSIDAARQRLREALQRRVGEPGAAGVLAALSLGDQAAISRADWALFRDTGLSHLLSVSGLHVTMFAWAAQGLLGWAWRGSARLCLRCPAPAVARWGGVAAALAYALFSGWGVPAQRTVWMLASLALLRSLGLRWPWPLALLLSALVVTVVDPWAVCQAGFWLSFCAVGLLMAAGDDEPARGWRAQLMAGLRNQAVATLGLAPLSLLFFQQLSLVGVLANLLAIPWVSLVITPLALGGAILPGLWIWGAWCVELMMALLRWLVSWPLAVWTVPVAPLWAQAAGLAAGVLLVLPLPWRLRALGMALALPLLWPAPERPSEGEFEFLAADVGQGTAVLLRTAHHALLYDAGPQYAPGVDAGQRVLLPLLRALGVRQLDQLMLSHRDSDHVGGAASVAAGLPVQGLRSSLEPSHPLHRLFQSSLPCNAGERWVWDGVQFELLHPSAEQVRQQQLKSNELSCVLHVRNASGQQTALLMGDLEAGQEAELLRRHRPGALRAELLLVPHHGSKTSSTPELLAAVAPRWAVVQSGYRNRFGHPALPVLARYQAAGIEVFNSPDCGAWRWRSEKEAASCQRLLDRRYWHRRPLSMGADRERVGPPEAERSGEED